MFEIPAALASYVVKTVIKLAIRLFYLYSDSDVHALRHQGTTASRLSKIGISQGIKYVIVLAFCKSGHISMARLGLC